MTICRHICVWVCVCICFTCISVKLGADCVLCRISKLCNNRLSSVRLDWQRASSKKKKQKKKSYPGVHKHITCHKIAANPLLGDLSKGRRLNLIHSFCKIRFVPDIRREITRTLGTLVHLLWLLEPGNHLALSVAVGGRQAATAAAAGGCRLPRRDHWLGLQWWCEDRERAGNYTRVRSFTKLMIPTSRKWLFSGLVHKLRFKSWLKIPVCTIL